MTASSPVSAPASARSHGRLLLVEDDVDAAGLAQAHFARHGYDVLRVATAEEALVAASSTRFDLVVLDLILPRSNGADLLGMLRHRPGTADADVVVSSILDRRDYPSDITAALPKPFSRADVADLVARLDTLGR